VEELEDREKQIKEEKRQQLQAQARQRSKQQSLRTDQKSTDQKNNFVRKRVLFEGDTRDGVVEDSEKKMKENQPLLQAKQEGTGLSRHHETVSDAIIISLGLYKPSADALANTSKMLEQVCGPSLSNYKGKKEFFFAKRNVRLYTGRPLSIPVKVSTPGTLVEFSIDKKASEFDFGISVVPDQGYAEDIKKFASFLEHAGEGKSLYRDTILVDSASAPGRLQFKFENKHSTLLEKVILSYEIKVTSPSKDSLLKSRRLRAESCLRAVEDDMRSMTRTTKSSSFQEDVDTLEAIIKEKTEEIGSLMDEERRWKALIAKIDQNS